MQRSCAYHQESNYYKHRCTVIIVVKCILHLTYIKEYTINTMCISNSSLEHLFFQLVYMLVNKHSTKKSKMIGKTYMFKIFTISAEQYDNISVKPQY